MVISEQLRLRIRKTLVALPLLFLFPTFVAAQEESDAARNLLTLVEQFDVCTNLGFTAENEKLINERDEARAKLRRLEILIDSTGVKIEKLEAEAAALKLALEQKKNSDDKEVQRLQVALAASLAKHEEMARMLEDNVNLLHEYETEFNNQQKKIKQIEKQNKALTYEKVARQTLEREIEQLLDASNVPLEIIQQNEEYREQAVNCNYQERELKQQLSNLLAEKIKLERESQNLTDDLQAALAARLAADTLAKERLSALEQREILLSEARKSLGVSEDLLEQRASELIEALKQQELLNQQVTALRTELGKMQELLTLSEQKDADSQIQLQNLGNRLNAALARAASEERKRRKAEEAERIRLEAEANKLEEERDQLATEASKLAKLNYDWKQKEKAYLARIQKLEDQTSNSPFVKPIFQGLYNKTVQEILKRKGCGVGVIDGKIGPRSISAAKAFAKVAGFKFSGSIYDEEFYEKLTESNRRCTAKAAPSKRAKCQEYPGNCTDFSLCVLATQYSAPIKRWSTFNIAHVAEARNRGLKCGVR